MDSATPAGAASDPALRNELLEGLSAPQKRLPSKLFYDQVGSELFDRICELPEYYVTRTEASIMRMHAAAMAAAVGPRSRLVEFGSGSSTKTRLLLDHLDTPEAYVPVDISAEHLHATAARLREDYPALAIEPLTGDFTAALPLPEAPAEVRTAVYFPGSTLGNFEPEAALALLRRIRAMAGADGGLLLGADLRKPAPVLLPAYDDAAGVTAAFNLHLLHRLNREFGADFRLESFQHRAVWNEAQSRIEMHLVARHDLEFTLFDRRFAMRAGESLHTENSHKYSLESLRALADRSGFRIVETWTDPQQWFAVQWWRSRPDASMALAA